jgi:hypothetical protein
MPLHNEKPLNDSITISIAPNIEIGRRELLEATFSWG